MALKTSFQVVLFLFLLFNLFSQSCSSVDELEFDKWISWNVNSFQMRQSNLETEIREGLEKKLKKAEMNKVRINVSQDGTGDFKTIGGALHSIPLHKTRRTILQIKPGVYREKIAVPSSLPFVTFLGDSSNPPTILWNDTATSAGKTFSSATVAINASYFVAINMKFVNDAPYEIGSVGGQAVALRTSGNKSAFYNCSFYGNQDTLYDHKGFHYFNNCFIQGSVDFIFGYGRSLYENCQLNSTAKNVSFVTAQKRTMSSLSSGFSFKDSQLTGSGRVYLGRAWGDYSRVVFSYTYMQNIVLPGGWDDWGDPDRDSRVYYGEYKCSGPGANLSERVRWARALTDQEAMPFIGTHYIDGHKWLLPT
ncbi:probable pectinesterase 53 [Diospyros lotus]|uniref:probable pectinesterase 53 n=1 Tax=Diospyros lotus TaxID=55363 RepID=UPI00224DC0BA|nr:probable pectinesterase 53 [Diospyros lotus]